MLCISKAIFEKLTLAAREFFVKEKVLEYIPAPVQKSEPQSQELPPFLPIAKEAGCLEYIPTSIWQTRDSKFWQWRRFNEWWREYGQDDQRQIAHEKRHIY